MKNDIKNILESYSIERFDINIEGSFLVINIFDVDYISNNKTDEYLSNLYKNIVQLKCVYNVYGTYVKNKTFIIELLLNPSYVLEYSERLISIRLNRYKKIKVSQKDFYNAMIYIENNNESNDYKMKNEIKKYFKKNIHLHVKKRKINIDEYKTISVISLYDFVNNFHNIIKDKKKSIKKIKLLELFYN